MRQPIWLLLLACVLMLAGAALKAPRESAAGERHAQAAAMPRDYLLTDIAQYRRETWRWQALMGLRKSRAGRVHHVRSPHYRRWMRNLWRERAVKHRRRAYNPPHAGAWRCIQRHEGRWNDPNGPYYGGLQMDLGFLLRKKGTADNWTAVEQMWVAERAYRAGRGFYPWPNAARYCGLI
jgi:hypothetical protein